LKEQEMKKSFFTDRSNRRDFLRVSVASVAGIALVEFVGPKELRASGSYSGQIQQSSDDAGESNTDGMVVLTDTQISLKDKENELVGLRFQSVTVPNAATITSATLTVDLVTAPRSASNELLIFGELAANSATFTAILDGLASRTRTMSFTAAIVPESTGTWNISTTDPLWTGSSDLTAVIQEIVNQTGWASGNALSFIIDTDDSTQLARIEAYDGSPSNAAQLAISYS
jgi:type IV pilus assembly protein PilY1